jgi:hypothetical protein
MLCFQRRRFQEGMGYTSRLQIQNMSLEYTLDTVLEMHMSLECMVYY